MSVGDDGWGAIASFDRLGLNPSSSDMPLAHVTKNPYLCGRILTCTYASSTGTRTSSNIVILTLCIYNEAVICTSSIYNGAVICTDLYSYVHRTNYGFIIYTQSQDGNITSDALSRCQKNQKNPGPQRKRCG